MGSRIIHELCVSVRQYQDGAGKTKNQYQKIGNMFEKDEGGRFMILEPYINLAGIPHEPGKGIMVSMFDPKPRDGQQGQSGNSGQKSPQQGDDGFATDIPF